MPAEQKPTLPTWWVALVALVVSLATSAITFSFFQGQLSQQVEQTRTDVSGLKKAYEDDKAKRAADAEAKVAAYEAERAARMARIEQIAERLQDSPTPTKPR